MAVATAPQIAPRIGTTLLAQLNGPTACPRCIGLEWLLGQQRAIPFRMPMPGIFSSIDSHTKQLVRAALDQGKVPDWMPDLGVKVVGYVASDRLSWQRFNAVLDGLKVTGAPDEVLMLEGGRHFLLDYKTARFTDTQADLLPRYEAQLDTYALIGAVMGLLDVYAAALIYFEPIAGQPVNGRAALDFSPLMKPIPLDLDLPHDLLVRAHTIMDQVNAGDVPAGRDGCEQCAVVDRWRHIDQVLCRVAVR